MTSRQMCWVIAISTAVVLGVLVSVGWTAAALQDPAKTLGLNAQGVLRWGENRSRAPFSVAELAMFLGVGLAFVAAGMTAWRSRPSRNPGVLLVAAGLLWLAGGLRRSNDPVAFTIGVSLTLMYQPPLLQLALSFPSGVLRTQWEKTFVVFFYVSWAFIAVAGWAFFDPTLHTAFGTSTSRNLLLIRDSPDTTTAIGNAARVFQICVGLAIFAVLIYRWHAGTPAYRAVFLPLWLAVIVKTGATIWISLAVVQLSGSLSYTALLWQYPATAMVPLAVLFGLWRYRFARGTLGDLMVEIGAAPLSEGLVRALRRSVHDPTLSLWQWSEALQQYVDDHGMPRMLPDGETGRAAMVLERRGTPFGALVFDETLREQPQLLAALRSATALSLENQRMEEQLRNQLIDVRRSRERIVTAGDHRRRQLERDLHDGAQQRLVAVVLGLSRAQRLTGSEDVRALIEQAGRELRDALVELRELARGVYPPSLRERGLIGAVTALAERVPLPIQVVADLPDQPPPPVELAAYFICAEAVTNAVKYASATRIQLTVATDAGQLSITISDDGIGGADPSSEGGLLGLADRAAALGGSLEVHSPVGQGTTVRARLPFVSDPAEDVP
ncbi:two-component sensor histidine kinase [Paenarthrobacter sp. Z7-10]|uniref:ATP-binding protein n=1 Tax=Paenarthrobacter sp. Z7-10 TaxID=2787635 RepID=UPI0022A92DDA|nr:ATP-binding protein [Paenarthrobacter sp. Z7-10]MCZ2405058.1 two-component sensor histidine kinase [Paenarthrobacter sp. Z7-10]